MGSFAFLKHSAPGIILGVLLLLPGTGGLLGLRAQRPPAPAQRHVVEIHDFRFEPAQLVAALGDTVVWINRDIVPHTATGVDETWDSGTLEETESWSLVVQAVGQQVYYCRFHPTMKGALRVK